MMDPDLRELVSAWLGGPVPADRRDHLLDRLRSDAAFRAAFAEEVRMLGTLKVLRANTPRWLRLEDELGWSAGDEPPGANIADAVAAEIRNLPTPGSRSRWAAAPAAVAVFAIALAVVVVAFRDRPPPSQGPAEDVALVSRLEGARWKGGAGPAEGETLRPGPLVLTEGAATLALFSGVTVRAEAPAEFDLESADRVVCRRGRLRVDVPPGAAEFTAAAPGAAVTAAAEFAVTVGADGQTDVLVVDGRAEVSVTAAGGPPARPETVSGGRAVRITPGAQQVLAVARTVGQFAGPISPVSCPLPLAPGYPAAVLADRPAGYWRFEVAAGGLTPNEVAGGPPLRLVGPASTGDGAGGNRTLNLPAPTEGEQGGAVAVAPWGPSGVAYTVECWAMPRQVRQAVAVGLVADAPAQRLGDYGSLLELTGQPAVFRMPPRRVRGLHRLPVAQSGGVNLFSPGQYLPCRWTHLVVRRDADRFELFVDGQPVGGTPAGDGRLPAGRVLVGALYAAPDGNWVSDRPFVGQVDEVAVYDHALPPEAIRRHYQLGSGGR